MALPRRQVLLTGLTAALGLGSVTGCVPGRGRRDRESWARGLEAALTALAPIESATVKVRTNFAESTKAWTTAVAGPKPSSSRPVSR